MHAIRFRLREREGTKEEGLTMPRLIHVMVAD